MFNLHFTNKDSKFNNNNNNINANVVATSSINFNRKSFDNEDNIEEVNEDEKSYSISSENLSSSKQKSSTSQPLPLALPVSQLNETRTKPHGGVDLEAATTPSHLLSKVMFMDTMESGGGNTLMANTANLAKLANLTLTGGGGIGGKAAELESTNALLASSSRTNQVKFQLDVQHDDNHRHAPSNQHQSNELNTETRRDLADLELAMRNNLLNYGDSGMNTMLRTATTATTSTMRPGDELLANANSDITGDTQTAAHSFGLEAINAITKGTSSF